MLIVDDIRIFQLSMLLSSIAKTKCPYCKSHNIRKYGRTSLKRQRYQCKDCHRCFSQFTATPFSYSKKSLLTWAAYIMHMTQIKTLKECADSEGLCLCTSFYWRHKLLNSLSIQDESHKLQKVVQIFEMAVPYNQKGNQHKSHYDRSKYMRPDRFFGPQVRVFSCADICGNYALIPAGRYVSENVIRKYIAPRVAKNSIIATVRDIMYRFAFKDSGINVKYFSTGADPASVSPLCPKEYISVNQSFDFKRFLNKFNGVNSRYLYFYCNWFIWSRHINGTASMLLLAIMKKASKIRAEDLKLVPIAPHEFNKAVNA